MVWLPILLGDCVLWQWRCSGQVCASQCRYAALKINISSLFIGSVGIVSHHKWEVLRGKKGPKKFTKAKFITISKYAYSIYVGQEYIVLVRGHKSLLIDKADIFTPLCTKPCTTNLISSFILNVVSHILFPNSALNFALVTCSKVPKWRYHLLVSQP